MNVLHPESKPDEGMLALSLYRSTALSLYRSIALPLYRFTKLHQRTRQRLL
jgi:hypothetical protein